MKTIKGTFRLIVTLLLLGGWALAASAVHVVRTGDSPLIIPKDRLGMRDTYVNVAAWSADDVASHPLVSRRLIATGNVDVLAHAFKATSFDDLKAQINEAIVRGPTTAPAPTAADKVVETVDKALEQAKAATGH
jgi:hypothetical protein